METLNFTSDTLQILLEQSKESFIENFNKIFFLDKNTVNLLFKIIPSHEKRQQIFKAATIAHEVSISGILDELDKEYTEEGTEKFLTGIGHLDWLLYPIERRKKFIQQNKYLNEICCINQRKRQINDLLYRYGHKDILVNNKDWITLAYYDEAELLMQNKRYEEMLCGAQKCYEHLYSAGKKQLIIEKLQKNKNYTSSKYSFSPFLFLAEKNEYELLSQKQIWKKNPYWGSHHALGGSSSFEFFLNILIYKEKLNETDEELWNEFTDVWGFHWYIKADYLKHFNNPVALEIWLYKNLVRLGMSEQASCILNQYPKFSKRRRMLKSSKYSGRFDEIISQIS